MIYEVGWLQSGDILLFDGERAFSTEKVTNFLQANDIYPFVIRPSLLHQFINPANNNFHSVFKLKYYRCISARNTSSLSVDKKIRIARACYDSISDSAIVSMFKKCGLIESEIDKRTIVYNLMLEGLSAIDKHKQHHKQSLASYLKWCHENDLPHVCSGLSRGMLRMAGMIS
jgi:hypothetical protein